MAGDPVDRARLPIADPEFAGVANRTLEGSRPDWGLIGHVAPPEGAPNVLLVLIDDAGFGQPSAFGGPIAAPAMSRVCDEGVRFNRFHVTALCSPTRAALLTGRNHHAVGFGSIGELSSGFPGYTAFVPQDSAPFPKVLQGNGYSTAAFGKWHLTPDGQQGAAGPFGRWPNGWGFDHFWGFLGGESGQWDPVITENNTTIGVPQGTDGEKYYFPDDMADKTIEWLHAVRAQDQAKPWFVYFSTGCAHAPHHVPEEWAAKYKGRFDGGWDALREETFERQKRLGVVPADAYTITAELAVPASGAEGVIVAEADHLGGFSLFVAGGKLRHTYSMMGVQVYRQESDTPLPAGEVTVQLEFHADGAQPGTGGDVRLFANGTEIGKGRMDHSVPLRFSGYAGMDIGRDNGGVVDRAYADKAPFAFTGTIKKVVFDIKPHLSADDDQALHESAHHGHVAHGISG
jgi:hypothetical protein